MMLREMFVQLLRYCTPTRNRSTYLYINITTICTVKSSLFTIGIITLIVSNNAINSLIFIVYINA